MSLAVAEERCRWDLAAKARKKRANVRSSERGPVVQENSAQEVAVARSEQEGSVVVLEDSVASVSEAAVGAMPADVRSV